jgi:hypothetical protein
MDTFTSGKPEKISISINLEMTKASSVVTTGIPTEDPNPTEAAQIVSDYSSNGEKSTSQSRSNQRLSHILNIR